jgi:RNA recognition motif-containing protein
MASSYNQLFDSRHAVDPKINMEEYAYNKIFVGGLHYDTRDGDLPFYYHNLQNSKLRYLSAEFRHYFERYGKVVSAEVMFNRETHKSRGFGFIVFELEQGAVKVCADKEHVIDGKVVSWISGV